MFSQDEIFLYESEISIFLLSTTYVTGIIDPDRQRCRSTINHASHLPPAFNNNINHDSFDVLWIKITNILQQNGLLVFTAAVSPWMTFRIISFFTKIQILCKGFYINLTLQYHQQMELLKVTMYTLYLLHFTILLKYRHKIWKKKHHPLLIHSLFIEKLYYQSVCSYIPYR